MGLQEMRSDKRIGSGRPPWLHRTFPADFADNQLSAMFAKARLHTVCEAANCPNRFECYACDTATFLIMGNVCTRNCRFCNIQDGVPEALDADEPRRVAMAAAKLNLGYVVITSVTRDDLADGGADHFAATIAAIRHKIAGVQVEVLIPDFKGERAFLEKVSAARPDVINHNMETVRRLYPVARPQARYDRSLELLNRVRSLSPDLPAKSGIMLGLGETEAEVREVIEDIYRSGCHMLTIGQYLQPTQDHLPVADYIAPQKFDAWRNFALERGFEKVEAGPFVRSSYHAKRMFNGTV